MAEAVVEALSLGKTQRFDVLLACTSPIRTPKTGSDCSPARVGGRIGRAVFKRAPTRQP